MVDLTAPLRGEPLFDEKGNLTIRFAEYLDRLGIEVNSLNSSASRSFTDSSLAKLDDIQQQIGSGDALTWDDTGFTWDSTQHSFDQTEA